MGYGAGPLPLTAARQRRSRPPGTGAIFLLSFCEPPVQAFQLQRLEAEALNTGIGTQFSPALDGLAHVIRGTSPSQHQISEFDRPTEQKRKPNNLRQAGMAQ